MTRNTVDAALVERLLEIPGVTEQVLRKAIYRYRAKQGLCTKGNGGCNEPALPGRPFCKKHTELQDAANARYQARNPRG